MDRPTKPPLNRVDSVDFCRGLIMVLMALDHVRDYLHLGHFNAADLTRASAPLFLTRWITHFCAPGFMFLAGVSAFLYKSHSHTRNQLSRFLLMRGLWLILLEHTLVRLGWHFKLDYSTGLEFLVLWALGISMIVLAGLLYLPRGFITLISLAMIAGHNLFDGVDPASLGSLQAIWFFLHQPGPSQIAGWEIFVLYPIIPWIGVMPLGYAMGSIFNAPRNSRRRILLVTGTVAVLAFLAIRSINKYGDPTPWAWQSSQIRTVLSFLNTEKYPPSLLYLLMTLGPLLIALSLLDASGGPLSRRISIIGRVPMVFYLLHIYLIHAITVGVGVWQGYPAIAFLCGFFETPENFGLSLPAIYLWWFVVVAALYIPCRWYSEYKRAHNAVWLSYL